MAVPPAKTNINPAESMMAPISVPPAENIFLPSGNNRTAGRTTGQHHAAKGRISEAAIVHDRGNRQATLGNDQQRRQLK